MLQITERRNRDLMSVFRCQLGKCDQIKLREVIREVINSPSKRFWVSEERAAIVVSRMMKGDNLAYMTPTKREMFREIYTRSMLVREENPDMSLFDIMCIVVQQQAPKFYLTEKSAVVIIHKIKKSRCRKQSGK